MKSDSKSRPEKLIEDLIELLRENRFSGEVAITFEGEMRVVSVKFKVDPGK